MATKIGFSFSSSHFQHNTNAKLRSSQFVNQLSVAPLAIYDKDKLYLYIHGVQKLRGRPQKQQTVLVVGSEDHSQISELETEAVEPENHDSTPENNFPISNSSFHLSGNDGKPGVVSFHNRAFSRDNEVILSNPERTQNSISWFMGPAVLFAALVVPPFCSHKVLRSVCGDSPLLPLDAELCAIHIGLEEASKVPFTRLIVESDSIEAISMITGSATSKRMCHPIAEEIRMKASELEQCEWQHVLREANGLADAFSKFGLTNKCTTTLFRNIPAFAISHMQGDLVNLEP